VQVYALDLPDARFFLKYLLASSGLVIFTDTAVNSAASFLRRFDDLSRSHILLLDMTAPEKKMLPSLSANTGSKQLKENAPTTSQPNSVYTLNHIKFERSQSQELRKEILRNTLGMMRFD
jgi:hypothetical protein